VGNSLPISRPLDAFDRRLANVSTPLFYGWRRPWTFVYELDTYPLELYRMCENKLATSRLSKVIVLQTDIHTPTKLPRRLVYV